MSIICAYLLSIPTTSGLNIDAGYEFNAETEMSLFEGLGIHTFTYISTRYNGIYARSPKEADALWEWYVDNHWIAISRMLKEIGDTKSNLHKQATELIGNKPKGLTFITNCEKYTNGESVNFDNLLYDFKKYILEPKKEIAKNASVH